MAGTALQIPLESLGEVQSLEGGVELDSPRRVFGGVQAFTAVVFCKPIFEVRCMASIKLSWSSNALENVREEHLVLLESRMQVSKHQEQPRMTTFRNLARRP